MVIGLLWFNKRWNKKTDLVRNHRSYIQHEHELLDSFNAWYLSIRNEHVLSF